MTVQEFYESAGGDYSAAKKVMLMDPMILRCLKLLSSDPSRGRLAAALERGDRKEMFEVLHAMKGVLANLGLTSLSALAAETLEPLRPNSSLTITDEELGTKTAQFCEQYNRTLAMIEKVTG